MRDVVIPKASPCLCGSLIYLAMSQAYWFVVLQTLQEYAAPPITHCPFVLFSLDALTFLCSSEHQQGMHFRKSQARQLPLDALLPHRHTSLDDLPHLLPELG